MKKNELAPTGGFAALSDFNLANAILEELTGLDEGFERIKIPAGGIFCFICIYEGRMVRSPEAQNMC